MSELVTTRICEAANRLHLANLAENLDALVTRSESSAMGYLEFLDLVLEEETGIREGRRFRNALKLSSLPHHKTLDELTSPSSPISTPARQGPCHARLRRVPGQRRSSSAFDGVSCQAVDSGAEA